MTPVKRVLEAIEEIKKGRMIIMVDDEDRENEGDLVYASAFSTPEHVNFMATHARGLICVAISKTIATRLALNPMVSSNTSTHETAFTVSVDAKSATTGISAKERDDTIKILANPISHADELVKPGHIFPLIAKDGGVLVRTGLWIFAVWQVLVNRQLSAKSLKKMALWHAVMIWIFLAKNTISKLFLSLIWLSTALQMRDL